MPENLKKDFPKNKKKLKDDAKIGITIAASAALFFGCIFAIERGLSDNTEPVIGNVSTDTIISVDLNNSTSTGPVVEVYDPLKENVNKPYMVNVTLERPFYDSSLPIEERMKAVVNLPGEETYFKSQGEDYSSSTAFDVYASFSGKVTKTENNSIYGNVVWIEHESGVVSIYASLGEIKVNEGQEVKQNDVVGTSGTSAYTQEVGKETLHFELSKDKMPINPKTSYGQLVKNL